MARQAAREILGRKALGEDLDARPDMTEIEALEWYRDTYAYERSYQYQKMVNQMINNLFSKSVQRRLPTDMKRADWLDISEGQARKSSNSSANWTEKQVKTMLNCLVERGLLASNPLAGVRNRFKTKSRDRVLSDAELKTVWDTIQTYDDRRRLAFAQGDGPDAHLAPTITAVCGPSLLE